MRCRNAQIISSETVNCTLPPLAPNSSATGLDVVLDADGTSSDPASALFAYDPPVVSSVVLINGSLAPAGGGVINVTGECQKLRRLQLAKEPFLCRAQLWACTGCCIRCPCQCRRAAMSQDRMDIAAGAPTFAAIQRLQSMQELHCTLPPGVGVQSVVVSRGERLRPHIRVISRHLRWTVQSPDTHDREL